MRYAAFVLALATSVFGQSLTDLPSCSITCLTSAVSSSGCGITDTSCQCGPKKAAIVKAVTPCLQSSCSAADAASMSTFPSIRVEDNEHVTDTSTEVLQITEGICAGGSSSASAAASSASATAQASSAAGQSYGMAGALIAGAAILAL